MLGFQTPQLCRSIPSILSYPYQAPYNSTRISYMQEEIDDSNSEIYYPKLPIIFPTWMAIHTSTIWPLALRVALFHLVYPSVHLWMLFKIHHYSIHQWYSCYHAILRLQPSRCASNWRKQVPNSIIFNHSNHWVSSTTSASTGTCVKRLRELTSKGVDTKDVAPWGLEAWTSHGTATRSHPRPPPRVPFASAYYRV